MSPRIMRSFRDDEQDGDCQSDLPETTSTRATLEQELTNNKGLVVNPIGYVRSIYRLCVGTPRQGLLAPHARGRVELFDSDSVSGLESYSHVWIVFIFHLNTKAKNRNRSLSKISPPALGGDKVGVLATRSPHRPNPIGFTLAKLEKVEYIDRKRRRASKKSFPVVIHISGIDLVDGTPVLDIKPFVPHYDASEVDVRIPPWVEQGLATRRDVVISDDALANLREILTCNPKALEFYGRANEPIDETLADVVKCIEEVLSIDVRSSWQTKKVRGGAFQAQRAQRLQG